MLEEDIVPHLLHLETIMTQYFPKDHTVPKGMHKLFLAIMNDSDYLKGKRIDL